MLEEKMQIIIGSNCLHDSYCDDNLCKEYGLTICNVDRDKAKRVSELSIVTSIAFGEWLAINYVPTSVMGEIRYWQKGTYQNKEKFYSTQELYDVFISNFFKK
jgi:hypothetical protein